MDVKLTHLVCGLLCDSPTVYLRVPLLGVQVGPTFGGFVVVLTNGAAEAHVCVFPGVRALSFWGSEPSALLAVRALQSGLTKQAVAACDAQVTGVLTRFKMSLK